MDLKEKIVSSYVAFEDGVNINSDIHEIRTEAFQNFEKLGFPSKKLEAWKYTSLNTILKEDYSIFQNKEKTINLADVKQYFISSEPGEEMKKIMEERGIPRKDYLIVDSEDKLEELYTTKYTLEGESRKLEAEVGPVKYIAELVYGQEPGRNVLEETVRYVILILVFVFDPLAIALVIALNQLIMTERKDEESSPGELKDFVDETTRIHLTEKDLKVLEEALLNPKEPNEILKKAADDYKKRSELLSEIIKNDEELGLYDDTSDWDATLMDGLEDEEPFFTEEEIEEILHEEPTEEEIDENFSTIVPEIENNFQEEVSEEEVEPSLPDDGTYPEPNEKLKEGYKKYKKALKTLSSKQKKKSK